MPFSDLSNTSLKIKKQIFKIFRIFISIFTNSLLSPIWWGYWESSNFNFALVHYVYREWKTEKYYLSKSILFWFIGCFDNLLTVFVKRVILELLIALYEDLTWIFVYLWIEFTCQCRIVLFWWLLFRQAQFDLFDLRIESPLAAVGGLSPLLGPRGATLH